MISRNYPQRDANPQSVFSQDTFDLATAQLLSWRQGPGTFGGLLLHGCWGTASVLDRRYHGMTVSQAHGLFNGFMQLYERTGDIRWRCLCDDVAANVLYLQTAGGGFCHASAEFEPAYTSMHSCPIHQGLPILMLLDYAAWPHANPERKKLIKPAIDAHWNWFKDYWWQRGTAWKGRLSAPGYCGVTNQDLVIVAALARYAVVFGDPSRYEQFGRPVLEAYLAPEYYYPRIGLFERGDQANFAERTNYYHVISEMLRIILESMPDPRLQDVIDNIADHLFDAALKGSDGLMHLAWGAVTDPNDKSHVKGWIRYPDTLGSYPGLLSIMRRYLARHPDQKRAAMCDALERTLASYVFADGTIPIALRNDGALFSVVGRCEGLWAYLMERLGAKIRSPRDIEVPRIHRSCGDTTWKSNRSMWAICLDGKRRYAGLKANPSGIAIGPDESVAGADFKELDKYDVTETVENLNAEELQTVSKEER